MTEREPDDGMCIVYAPSADPERPLILSAWWHEDRKQWEGVIPYWGEAVTHYIPVKELGHPAE